MNKRKRRRSRVSAVIAAAVFLCAAAAVYAAEDNITAQLSGPNKGGVYTADISVEYVAQSENAITEVALAEDAQGTKLIENNKATYTPAGVPEDREKTGTFTISAKWLSQNEPKGLVYKVYLLMNVQGKNEPFAKEVTFTADASEPKVALSGANKRGIYNTAQQITASAVDGNLENDTVKISIKRNGTEEKSAEGAAVMQGNPYLCDKDGAYDISLTAEDAAGRKASADLSFIVETASATLTDPFVTGDLNDGYDWFCGDVKITAQANKGISNIKSITGTINGETVYTNDKDKEHADINIAVTNDWIKAHPADVYQVQITVTNEAGNTVTKDASFRADVVAPNTELAGIEDGAVTNAAPQITVKSTDDHAQGLATSLLVYRDGKLEETITGADSATFSPETDGRYEVKARATDIAGNQSEEKALTFDYDTQTPEIEKLTADGPKREGCDWYYDHVDLAMSAKDSLSGIEKIRIEVNGVLIKEEEKSGAEASLEASLSKEWFTENKSRDGIYTAACTVTDAAGNASTKEISFFADVEAPSVKLSGVKDGAVTNEAPNITATASDDYEQSLKATISVYKDGQLIKTEEGEPKAKFTPTEDGRYEIRAVATDIAGNKSEEDTVTFDYDTAKPQITLFDLDGSKRAGFSWIYTEVGIDTAAEDSFSGIHRFAITVNGTEIFEKTYDGQHAVQKKDELNRDWLLNHESEDGNYEIRVSATDEAGNRETKEKNIHIDIVKPSVSLSGVKEGAYTSKTPSVKATVNDNYPSRNIVYFTVYRDKKKVLQEKMDGPEASISSFRIDGDYKVSVFCEDRAGNRSKLKTIRFTKDTTAPVVSLSGAKEGGYHKGTVSLTAEVKERNYDTTKVYTTLTKTYKKQKNNIGFKVVPTKAIYRTSKGLRETGEYAASIYAVDRAGNKSKTQKLSFIVDNTMPELKISGVNKENGYESVVAPKITYKDDWFDSREIGLKKSQGAIPSGITYRDSKTAKGGERDYADFAKVKENDGIYTLDCSVKDKAGNVKSEKVTFRINRYGATFTLGKKTKTLNGTYMKDVLDDLVINERSLTSLKKKKASISKDGVTQKDPAITESVKTANDGAYLYSYRYKAENFETEGVYTLNVTSEDSVGNFSEYTKDGRKLRIFVDRTPPAISVSGIENGGSYEDGTDLATINVSDAISLQHFSVRSGSEEIYDSGDDVDLQSSAQVSLPKGASQEIYVSAEDKAGNTASYTVSDVTVAKGPANTPVGLLPLLAGAGLAGIAIAVILMLRRRKKS